MFSGGLDSMVAVRTIQNAGVKVEAITFKSPFFNSKNAEKSAKQLGIKLKVVHLGNDYLKMIKKPCHGHGKNLNPCIDCKIFMLKKAKQHAKKIRADFIFTGEVLGQRPMSQNLQALNMIEKNSGLKGKLLRPLSAKLLPETVYEKKGVVDRNNLLSIQGRERKEQMALAEKFRIKEYPSPAGGCLLTEGDFCRKLSDYFRHNKKISMKDIEMLKTGRHFRFKKTKIVTGRNKEENEKLLKLKSRGDILMQALDVKGPVTIVKKPYSRASIEKAAMITARYSDSKDETARIKYGKKTVEAAKAKDEEIEKLRI